MGPKDEINRLFQKFVDKSISPEELELLCALAAQPENEAQMQQQLAELGDYLELIDNPTPEGSQEGHDGLQRKRQALQREIKKAQQAEQEILTAFKKIYEQHKGWGPANKKQSFWDWLKGLF